MTEMHQLDNGIKILFEQRPNTERLICDVMIAQGSDRETMADKGLLFLSVKALLGGTANLPRKALAEKIESKGASYGVVVSRENVIISCETLTQDMHEICGTVFDFVKNPAYLEAEIDVERQQMIKALKQRAQKPQNKVRDALWAQLSGEAGYLPIGTIENIENFTREQIMERHAALIADPDDIVLSFVGDAEMSEIIKLVETYFGTWQNTQTEYKPKGEHVFSNGYMCQEQDNEQLVMAFGFPAASRFDKQSYVYHMVMEALCGGMSSPMFQEVREKRGLVYSIWGDYMPYGDQGALGVFTSTGRGQCLELLETAIGVFADAVKNGFSDDVITAARERILRSIEYRSESSDYVCERQGLQMQYYGRVISMAETRFYLSAVTSEHMQYALFQALSAGKMAFANLGPQDAMPSQEALQNMVLEAIQDHAVSEAPFTEEYQILDIANENEKRQADLSKPEVTILENGLTIVSQNRPGTVSMGAWVGIGASYEEERVNGITHMMEHMMFRGTPNYAEGVIDHVIENEMGGNLNAYTSRDHTAYYFYSLRAEHMPEIVKICGDMVFHAHLDNLSFDGVDEDSKGERDVVIEEIRQYADDVQSIMRDQLMMTAYPNQAHGRPILGPETGIANMDIADLVAYRDRYYLPNNVVFVAVGPIPHEDIVAEVTEQYGALKTGDIPTLTDVEYSGGVVTAVNAQAVNAVCGIYWQTCAYADAQCHAFEILSEILTGGKSSAFYQQIIQDEKLAPYVAAHQSEYKHVGGFYMATSLAVADVTRFFDLFYAELAHLRRDLSSDALDKAKAQLKMAELSKHEANIEVCMELAETTLMLGGPKTSAMQLEELEKVAVADVIAAIDHLLAAKPTVSIVVSDAAQQKECPDLENILALRDQYQPAETQKAG